MRDLTHQTTDTIKIIILAVAVVLSVNYVFAAPWSGPTQAPTGGNVDLPVNVGSSPQIKQGALEVDGFHAYGGMFDGTLSVTGQSTFGNISAAAGMFSGAITGGSLNIGSGLITAGDGATSALSVGTSNNSTRTYLKIDAESTGGVKPPAADCADETDYGKMMFAFDQSYIYVCGYDVVNQIPAWWYADMQLQLPQS